MQLSIGALLRRPDSQSDYAVIGTVFLIGLIAIIIFFSYAFGDTVLRDGDTSWHIAAGQWISEHRRVPLVDVFSFSAPGRRWIAHEWLTEVILHLGYRGAGWSGVLALSGAAVAGSFVVIASYLRRWIAPLIVGILLVVLLVALVPFLLARPHNFAWLTLALWTVALLRARDDGRVPSLWLAAIMVIWANLHASYLVGIFLGGTLGLEALLAAPADQRVAVFKGWFVFGLSLIVATLATPNLIDGLIYPIDIAGTEALQYISEWNPTNFATLSVFEGMLLGGLLLLLGKGVRVPIVRLLAVLFLLHLAFEHSRHQAVFLIVSLLFLAEPVARAYDTAITHPLPDTGPQLWARRRELAPIMAVMALFFVGALGLRLMQPLTRDNAYTYPKTALAHLPPGLRDENGLNEYSFGGPLIMNGVKVFIDGRSDMYGDAFTADYVAIANKADVGKWEAARKKWTITWTMMPPDKPFAAFIGKQPGWVRIYADKWAVIDVEQNTANRLGLAPLRAKAGVRVGAQPPLKPASVAGTSRSPVLK
jgi:hypothetical protein